MSGEINNPRSKNAPLVIADSTEIVDNSQLHRRVRHSQTLTKACLLVLEGPDLGRVFELNESHAVIGRAPDVAVPVKDSGVSRRHAALSCDDHIVHLSDLDSANGTFVNGERLQGAYRLLDGDKITLGKNTLLKFTYCDELDSSYQHRLAEAALKDFLTGVYNRRYLMEQLTAEFDHVRRHEKSLAVIIFDVDYFKAINDNYGHATGDMVLAKLCALIGHESQGGDILARLGGEEFALICRHHTCAQAVQVAERLRRVVKTTPIECVDVSISITLSLGVAAFPELPLDNPTALVEAADRALYLAKRRGRDRVVAAR